MPAFHQVPEFWSSEVVKLPTGLASRSHGIARSLPARAMTTTSATGAIAARATGTSTRACCRPVPHAVPTTPDGWRGGGGGRTTNDDNNAEGDGKRGRGEEGGGGRATRPDPPPRSLREGGSSTYTSRAQRVAVGCPLELRHIFCPKSRRLRGGRTWRPAVLVSIL